ncbi:hypothetical protein E6H19_04610 [Candidatus Bathyarchaeota archaeon]|nr:MAG: hypothetical protein E6H19_04610 [Candidatus Bathyarchaeota archaeon]
MFPVTIAGAGSPGTASHSAPAVFTFTVGTDFAITASSPADFNTGATGSSTITITPSGGFTGAVNLATVVSPSTGLAANCPTSLTVVSGAVTGTCAPSSSTPGTYLVTITGTGGGHTHSATFISHVGDFSISAGSPVNFNSGATGSAISVSLTSTFNFAGTISLTAVTSPATGLTVTCPAPVSTTANATVAASCTLASTTAGTYGVTITGAGSPGTASHSAASTVHVGDFTISATSPSGAVGSSISSTITLTSTFNFVGTVALGDTVPAGLTCQSFSPSAAVSLATNGTGTANLSCTSTTVNAFNVNISGVGSPGTASHSTTATFTFTGVVDYTIGVSSPADFNTGATGSSTITITPLNGFMGTVTLTTVISPSTGLTANCPTSLTVTTGVVTGTCSPSSSAPGTYGISISASGGGHTHTNSFASHVGDFSISVGGPVNFNSGATGSAISVSLASTFNFAGTVSLAAVNIPATGLTVTCPAPVSITANATVAASCSLASTAAGTYGATITGIGSPGTASHFAVATVHVGDFSISATSPSGATSTSISSSITLTSTFNFVGSVALGDTVPSGLTCQPFSPTATVPLSANGTGMASISCTSTTANAFIVGINGVGSPGTASHSTTATFTFTGLVDFTISATSPADFNTGTTGSSTITITPIGSFTGAVTLTTVVSPSTGLTANCATSLTVTSGAVTGTCTPSSSTPGTYTVSITATGGGRTHTASFVSHVGDFTISATSPSGATGTSMSSTITLTSTFNFVGSVALSDTPLPAGLTCNPFTVTPVSLAANGTGTSSLSCTSTTANAFTVTITGTGSPGTASQSTTATFTFAIVSIGQLSSVVTDGSLCGFGDQFHLIFVQSNAKSKLASGFTLAASNPGQFAYNVFFNGTAGTPVTLSMSVPYPFVTQGTNPVQVFSNFGLQSGCFVPINNVSNSFAITPAAIALTDYSAQALGSTVTITVSGSVPSSGMVYLTVHLNYGLKGSSFGKSDDNATNPGTGQVVIPDDATYSFSVSASSLTDTQTIVSDNVFKQDRVVAGIITDQMGSPVANISVSLFDSGGNLVAMAFTDADGFVGFHPHISGKSTFTVESSLPDGTIISQVVTVRHHHLEFSSFSVTV